MQNARASERILTDARRQAEQIVTEARQDRERARQEREEAAREREIAADARIAVDRELAEAIQERENAQRARAILQQDRERIIAEARNQANGIIQQAREAAGNASAAAEDAVNRRASVIIFFHDELAAATTNFDEACSIGSGGFGTVYIAPRLTSIASEHLGIKRLDETSMQGQVEFLQEVQVLGGCRHENLLVMVGFSTDRGELRNGGVCLVTPLMKGGSLEDRLRLDASARQRLQAMPGAQPADEVSPLTWQQRLWALVGALCGLVYLHTPDPETHKPKNLHRDIKPSNILLGQDLNARLSDMGLAREQRPVAAHATTVTSIAGTNGYMDDYYQSTGRFDEAADGYAMGVSILVTLTGWAAVDPAQGHIIGRCEVDDIDDVVGLADARVEWEPEVVKTMHKVGMDLVKRNRSRRISVQEALERLQEAVNIYMPPALPTNVIVERECIMCMSAPRHVRFECGHAALCRDCAETFFQRGRPVCPHCRAPVTQAGTEVSDAVANENTFVRPRPM